MFLLNCCVSNINAQQFSFEIITEGFSPTDKIYLKKYHGREELLVDSVIGSSKSNFSINTLLPVKGLYIISYSKSAFAELIYSPEEKMTVKVSKEKLADGQITIDNSAENVAYQDFTKVYFEYDYSFNPIVSQKYDEFDPQYITKLQDKTKLMVILQSVSNNTFKEISAKYPNTFTGKILAPMVVLPEMADKQDYLEKYDNYQAFLFRHYWDNLDFSQNMQLNHFMLNEMLKNYYRNFVPKHPDSMKVAIDLVLDKAKNNPEIHQHIHSFLLRNFLRSNAEDLTLYMVNKGNGETCDLNLSPEELQRFETLKSLSIGSKVPETSLPDINQQKIPLSEVYKANIMTLVIFWTAHCSKCQAEIPKLKKIYDEYKDHGFQVYAINLDENKFSWREAITEMQLDWVNVTDEVPLKDSQVLIDFNVVKTPQSFLLSESGKIILKDLPSEKLSLQLSKLK